MDFLEGHIVVHYHSQGVVYIGIVLVVCMLVWWDISILPLYMQNLTLLSVFMVMSLLKFSSLSSVPLRYYTSGVICIIPLPVVISVVDIFQSWALEPNVMYSILLVFSLSLIVSIQDFIAARVCSSLLCVLFCFFKTEAGNDFIREWLPANPFTIMSSITTLSIRALWQVKMLEPLHDPQGTPKGSYWGLEYLLPMHTLNWCGHT